MAFSVETASLNKQPTNYRIYVVSQKMRWTGKDM